MKVRTEKQERSYFFYVSRENMKDENVDITKRIDCKKVPIYPQMNL